MHIAFLTPEYPHYKVHHAAGIGTSIKNLAQALVQQEVKVTVFIYGQKQSEVFEEKGISFHLIADKRFAFGKWFFYRKHIQNYCNAIIQSNKIDLMEAADWTGITAFMSFKIPLVIRFHGSDTYFCKLEKRKQKWKNRWFETLAVRNAQGYIAPTKFAGTLSADLFGLTQEKVQTIHYGLDLLQFKNEQPEVFEQGLVLYVGTLIRKKGVFELAEIFKKVVTQQPDAHLVLIGGDSADIKTGKDSTWRMLEQEFPIELRSKVTYLGQIQYAGVQAYIQKANVCVFPSYAETLGMVTIEAMAMQKAVVNSNIGWAQELMEDEKSGFLVHPSNHDLYADKIIQILENKYLSLEIGRKARRQVEKVFDIEKKCAENINFYQQVIAGNV
ncbi:glycosyltransferase family 4 protein [Flavobacterium sp. XN-5]|uniref:glycosyltransferase family 4 protein n=1 Tax=Flavobacterium sp. XN-5 TaxID=2599390 RepID=UPI0011C6F5E1|nr:glycosyltransferase family 4 protein [Flavobacterium sp. XN-5]NGY37460.1 glycosyltransferase family 4 protein [Flavobacterium sp. XN-5]